jgi:hypothetical protein
MAKKEPPAVDEWLVDDLEGALLDYKIEPLLGQLAVP